MAEKFQFNLNGSAVEVEADSEENLLWVLRSTLDFTGTKYGCGLGYCGACTILIDGKAERRCMLTVDYIQNRKVTTIEGLRKNGELHPVQKAFMKHDALQCGYCTPGMIMTACSLLNDNPDPSKQEIIDGMEENLCRCGTQGRIIAAIQDAAKEIKGRI